MNIHSLAIQTYATVRQTAAVDSVVSFCRCVFWQLVPVTCWARCLEETPVIQTQEGVFANASSMDITAISVWYGSKHNSVSMLLPLYVSVYF